MGCAFEYVRYKAKHDINGSFIVGDFNGELLKEARESRGYSVDDLSSKTSIMANHITELEMGLCQPTEYELSMIMDLLDFPRGFFFRVTETLDPPERMIICGSGIQPCDNCGKAADYLCDYPVGEGKTCSMRICEECRVHVGKYDFCPIHTEANKVCRLI